MARSSDTPTEFTDLAHAADPEEPGDEDEVGDDTRTITVRLERPRPGTVELDRARPDDGSASDLEANQVATGKVAGGKAASGKAGDHTHPAPRRRHRRRASTIQTFATAAEFERVLSSATDVTPIAGPDEDPSPPDGEPDPQSDAPDPPLAAGPATSQPDTGPGSTTGAPGASEPGEPGVDVVMLPDDAPRTQSWSRIALLVAVLLLGIGVGAVIAKRDAGPDQPATVDREALDNPADQTAPAPPPVVDAGLPSATSPNTPDVANDMARPGSTGRGNTTTPSADAAKTGSDGPKTASRVRKTGTLKVGANPWAEVYLNSRKLGRAPGSWSVPTGRHKVEVVFPVTGRKQKKSFSITIEAGKTRSLGVIDFTVEL